MYLNEFRIETVLRLINIIKKNNTTDLVFNIDIDEKSEWKYATLSYCSFLHKVSARYFNPDEPMYPNPDAKCTLVTSNTFVQNLIPSEAYYKLISAE